MKKFLAIMLISLLAISATALAAPGRNERIQVLVGFDGSHGRQAIHKAGGGIEKEFGFINAAKVSIPAQAVEGLSKGQGIRYVELDAQAYALEQTVPWGISAVNAPPVHQANQYGAGINVAILDTGILLAHEDLIVWGGWDTFGTGSYNDDNGHGTHVAGTVAAVDNQLGVIGAAPQAKL
jgi:subtilisin